MKFSNIALAAAFALTLSGPAAAISSADIAADLSSTITAGNVHVTVDGNEATLFGWVEDSHSKQAAAQAALAIDGIDSVRNRIFTSN